MDKAIERAVLRISAGVGAIRRKPNSKRKIGNASATSKKRKTKTKPLKKKTTQTKPSKLKPSASSPQRVMKKNASTTRNGSYSCSDLTLNRVAAMNCAILENIFHRLSSSDLLNCATVCRDWIDFARKELALKERNVVEGRVCVNVNTRLDMEFFLTENHVFGESLAPYTRAAAVIYFIPDYWDRQIYNFAESSKRSARKAESTISYFTDGVLRKYVRSEENVVRWGVSLSIYPLESDIVQSRSRRAGYDQWSRRMSNRILTCLYLPKGETWEITSFVIKCSKNPAGLAVQRCRAIPEKKLIIMLSNVLERDPMAYVLLLESLNCPAVMQVCKKDYDCTIYEKYCDEKVHCLVLSGNVFVRQFAFQDDTVSTGTDFDLWLIGIEQSMGKDIKLLKKNNSFILYTPYKNFRNFDLTLLSNEKISNVPIYGGSFPVCSESMDGRNRLGHSMGGDYQNEMMIEPMNRSLFTLVVFLDLVL